jgi:hypothetical protein
MVTTESEGRETGVKKGVFSEICLLFVYQVEAKILSPRKIFRPQVNWT